MTKFDTAIGNIKPGLFSMRAYARAASANVHICGYLHSASCVMHESVKQASVCVNICLHKSLGRTTRWPSVTLEHFS